MGRRRYISTEISIDKRVRRLSDSAALLYTWMIPHTEENATITADPEELLALVFPNRPGWTCGKVVKTLTEIANEGLLLVSGDTCYFPPVSFYRYQTNIHEERRRTEQPPQTTTNSAGQRRTAQNSASPSPSSSSSKHMCDGFDEFYQLYPRKVGKATAQSAWVKAIKKTRPETITASLRRQLPSLKAIEPKFVPHASTWLNGERWLDEPDAPVAPSYTPAELPSLEGCVPMPANVRALVSGIGREIPRE